MPVLEPILLAIAFVALVLAAGLIFLLLRRLSVLERQQRTLQNQSQRTRRTTMELIIPEPTRETLEIARINEDLRQTKERLEKLDSVKTEFITIASHELRTPLTQVRGYIDILDAMNEAGMMSREQVGNTLGNLRKASDRMERLIADMLDVSQLDTDAMDLRFSPAHIDGLMKLAVEPFTEAVIQRRLALTSRGLRGLPPIQADMQRLVQAFRNIIGNAVKYTPDGGQITITGSLSQDALTDTDGIQIVIIDTGIGIDPQYQALIFEKFFRIGDPSLHSTSATKFLGAGPGLGLTIARGIIGGHGGRISVQSHGEDKMSFPGTMFTVWLPLKPPEGKRRVEPFLPAKTPARA